MSHSNAIILDSLSVGLQPIVRVIDDWFSARPLGLIAECSVGKGKLLITGIDLLTDNDKRPEAIQLRYSLTSYINSNAFNPTTIVKAEKVQGIFK
ncbi:hypothetical protein [Niabella hibiscisoli]|uniref:hypothetical protein n=1 Tax=Niabella hibiscisoli TaxID=1825928 RepID=UPI001F0FF329|nr:hypothetical protein [Niabella hibiscisoli]MCH5719284.1 hypothetical protein [Niabella hibiscisoli]